MTETIAAGGDDFLSFTIDAYRLAIPVTVVERVVAMPALAPLPSSPRLVAGVLNLHGQALAVIDPRRRLRLRATPFRISDRLIIVRTERRRSALFAASIGEIRRFHPGEITAADTVPTAFEAIGGVVCTSGGVVLICDPDRFLSHTAEARLERALAADGHASGA